jgi:YHS domain-containing protein
MKTKVLLLLMLFCVASLWAQTQPAAKAPAKEPAKEAAKPAPKKPSTSVAPQAGMSGCCCMGKMQGMQGQAGQGMMCQRMKGAKMQAEMGGCCCCGGHQHGAAPTAATADQPKDPVCGMAVNTETATKVEHNGKTYYFCAQHCAEAFKANPDKYLTPEAPKGN